MALRKLVAVIKGLVLSVPKPLFNGIAGFFYPKNFTFLREANAFADELGEPRALLQAAQLFYELTHLVDGSTLKQSAVGCTTAVSRLEDGAVTLFRTLDWDLQGMRDATRTFRFVGPGVDYLGVGTVGYVNVLTALSRRGFALALNDAPAQTRLRGGLAPATVIRRVMESCATAEEAAQWIRSRKMATSAFFTVCDANGSVVVEHTGRKANHDAVRERSLITNHYIHAAPRDAMPPTLDSVNRYCAALPALSKRAALDRVYARGPISVEATQYRARVVPERLELELF